MKKDYANNAISTQRHGVTLLKLKRDQTNMLTLIIENQKANFKNSGTKSSKISIEGGGGNAFKTNIFFLFL
jgi:hypothetical protein